MNNAIVGVVAGIICVLLAALVAMPALLLFAKHIMVPYWNWVLSL